MRIEKWLPFFTLGDAIIFSKEKATMIANKFSGTPTHPFCSSLELYYFIRNACCINTCDLYNNLLNHRFLSQCHLMSHLTTDIFSGSCKPKYGLFTMAPCNTPGVLLPPRISREHDISNCTELQSAYSVVFIIYFFSSQPCVGPTPIFIGSWSTLIFYSLATEYAKTHEPLSNRTVIEDVSPYTDISSSSPLPSPSDFWSKTHW